MLALGFSLIAAFPLPAHRNTHPKQVHQPVVRQTVLNVHRVPGRMEYRQALKVRRIPKHPKIIVAPSTAHRITATASPATIQVKPTAWALARAIENMQPVCCKPNAHDGKAKTHGVPDTVMDNVAFFGAGFSAGQMTGGVANGPSALLEAGLGEAVGNLGKVWCWEDLWFPAPEMYDFCPDAGLHVLKSAVQRAARAGVFALTIGGDHSVAAASIAGIAAAHPDLAVVWVDAHADANTPATSPSGHYHGMPAAHLMGWFGSTMPGFEWMPEGGCVNAANLAYIGLRDVDQAEARMLRDSAATVFTMHDVERLGIARVTELALAAIDPNKRRPLHLSLDIDSADPVYAPGTGTTASGGLTPRELEYLCVELGRSGRLVGMDLVEVNPDLDPPPAESARSMHGDNPALVAGLSPTVKLAAECVLAVLDQEAMR